MGYRTYRLMAYLYSWGVAFDFPLRTFRRTLEEGVLAPKSTIFILPF